MVPMLEKLKQNSVCSLATIKVNIDRIWQENRMSQESVFIRTIPKVVTKVFSGN